MIIKTGVTDHCPREEFNECDSRPQKADDRWSLVENTHPGKA